MIELTVLKTKQPAIKQNIFERARASKRKSLRLMSSLLRSRHAHQSKDRPNFRLTHFSASARGAFKTVKIVSRRLRLNAEQSQLYLAGRAKDQRGSRPHGAPSLRINATLRKEFASHRELSGEAWLR